MDVGNLISGYSVFSKSSWNIWKFSVHLLLKPDLENFEHYFANVWDECNCVVVWAFFGIAYLWEWNENWPFPVLWPLLSFPNLLGVDGNVGKTCYGVDMPLLLLLSRFSRVWLCASPEMVAHPAPLSLRFSRQEYWSGLPFPSPMHESEVVQSCLTLSNPMDCSLLRSSVHGIL